MFWVIAVIALIWNLLGVLAYLADALMTEDALKMLPTDQQELYAARPSWVTAAFAVAVWFGFLGAIGLIIRRKWAYPLFLLSFLGLIGQQVYTFFLSDTVSIMGAQAIYLPVITLLLGLLFIWYSKKSISDGILR